MSLWVLWVLAAVVLGAGEIVTMGFFLAPFALGAAVAALVAAAGSDAGSVVAFVLVTALTFGVVRPIARRHLRMPPQIRTGTAALVGRTGIVLERIANSEGVGVVKIDGEVWTARAYDEDDVIDAGARVHIMEIRGATALVSE